MPKRKRQEPKEPERYAGDPAFTTLGQAREWTAARMKVGAICPCCNRYARLWRTNINSSMALVLIKLVAHHRKRPPDEFTHVTSWLLTIGLPPKVAAAVKGDWAKLKHWGLIEEQPKEAKDDRRKKSKGLWRPTPAGRAFAEGHTSVDKYRWLYNDQPVEVDEENPQVTIGDCLEDKFDYSKVLDPDVRPQPRDLFEMMDILEGRPEADRSDQI